MGMLLGLRVGDAFDGPALAGKGLAQVRLQAVPGQDSAVAILADQAQDARAI